MKKILSIVLVLAICISSAVTVFASAASPGSPSPVSPTPGPTGPSSIGNTLVAKDAKGNTVDIKDKTLATTDAVYQEVKTAGTTEKFLETIKLTAAVDDAVEKYGIEAKDMKVASTIDVYVNSGTPTFPVTVTIPLAGIKSTDVVILIHKATTGYEVIPAVAGDSKVTATFNSLSPVVVLVATAKYTSYKDCKGDSDCLAAKFVDIDTKAWYHDGIHFCVEKGYIDGYDDTHFGPADTLSRSMMVTLLYKANARPTIASAATFKDVVTGQWYSDAIAWCEANKVIAGDGTGYFYPDSNITREMLATLLFQYAKFKGYATSATASLTKFKDAAKVSDWAKDAFSWATAIGIIEGTDAGTLNPQGLASRAEAAVLLQHFVEKFEK